MKNLKKWLLCRFGKHKWEYYTAGNQLVSINRAVFFVDIEMRECKSCGITEQLSSADPRIPKEGQQ